MNGVDGTTWRKWVKPKNIFPFILAIAAAVITVLTSIGNLPQLAFYGIIVTLLLFLTIDSFVERASRLENIEGQLIENTSRLEKVEICLSERTGIFDQVENNLKRISGVNPLRSRGEMVKVVDQAEKASEIYLLAKKCRGQDLVPASCFMSSIICKAKS